MGYERSTLSILAELVIALADLVEAEGRALRQSVMRTSIGFACLGAASLLLLLGVGWFLWGIYLWLVTSLGSAGAYTLIGSCALLFSGGLLWIAIRLGR